MTNDCPNSESIIPGEISTKSRIVMRRQKPNMNRKNYLPQDDTHNTILANIRIKLQSQPKIMLGQKIRPDVSGSIGTTEI